MVTDLAWNRSEVLWIVVCGRSSVNALKIK